MVICKKTITKDQPSLTTLEKEKEGKILLHLKWLLHVDHNAST